MFLALHFLRKDTRRLWWIIASSQTLLGVLVWMDCWREDSMPGMAEGWGNLIVPAVWALLIAMAVQEDPLAGRRQFWITTPCPWTSFLAAKVLFAACWVHLPYFIGCCAVLQARGFAPWNYVPQLLEKQLLAAAAVTLPAMAVAAAVKNLSHFAIWMLLTLSGAVYLVSNMTRMTAARGSGDALRSIAVLLVVAAGAAAILVLQYSMRRAMLGYGVGALTAAVATLVAALWTPQASALVRRTAEPQQGPPVRIQLPTAADAAALPRNYRYYYSSRQSRSAVALPAEVTGIQKNDVASLSQISLSLSNGCGESLAAAVQPFRPDRKLPALFADFSYVLDRRMPAWQLISLDARASASLREGPVRIEGQVMAVIHRRGSSTWMELRQRLPVPGIGVCLSEERELPYNRRALAVLCESPESISLFTEIRLYQPRGGLDWKHRLSDATSFVPWPNLTWLSPVNRAQTYFQISNGPTDLPASRWLVPPQQLPGAKLEFTPVHRISTTVVSYQATGVDLNRYAVPPAN